MKEGVTSSAPRVLTYLRGDHLGSVSLTTNASGQKVSEQRYKPYGEVRWSSGAGMPTDPSTDRITGPLRAGFTFTLRHRSGQRAGPANYVGSLMDYVARSYSPALGRFISADTIVPGAGNSQAYNRCMYVLGNPLGRVDPSGHCSGDRADSSNPDAACWTAFTYATDILGYEPSKLDTWDLSYLNKLISWLARGVLFSGDAWIGSNLAMAVGTLEIAANNLFNGSGASLMKAVGGTLSIARHKVSSDAEIHGLSGIDIWIPDDHQDPVKAMAYLAHEIGHRVDIQGGFTKGPGEWWNVVKRGIRETWIRDEGIGIRFVSSVNVPTDPGAVSHYALTDVGEDFAETFAYFALGGSYQEFQHPSTGRGTAFWSYFP